jgi:hypothetical protein
VYGLNANLFSGSTVQPLDSVGQKVCFATAALGVVYDIPTNQQEFFEGHTDDISCLAVARNGTLAATGQVAAATTPLSARPLCTLASTS